LTDIGRVLKEISVISIQRQKRGAHKIVSGQTASKSSLNPHVLTVR
jgi:hypothetical protein